MTGLTSALKGIIHSYPSMPVVKTVVKTVAIIVTITVIANITNHSARVYVREDTR